MNRLTEIGFYRVGCWTISDDELELQLERDANTLNVLYAFIGGGAVKYIGKTTQPLQKRLYSYANPGATQSTNIKNNANIKVELSSGRTIEIYILVDDGSLRRGSFHLNIAAGLEDSLINELQPTWNHGSEIQVQKQTKLDQSRVDMGASLNTKPRYFRVKIGEAYYNQGFFNVGIRDADYLGPENAEISLRLGKNGREISARINRRANGNETPRIMCGTDYRDWVQQTYKMGDNFSVEILSPLKLVLY